MHKDPARVHAGGRRWGGFGTGARHCFGATVAALLLCSSPIGISIQGIHIASYKSIAVQKGGNAPLLRASSAAAALRLRVLSLKGGGDYDDERTGWGTLDFNAADPNLLGPEDQENPWPEEKGDSDEEQQLVAGMKQKLVMGRDRWYDDLFEGVEQTPKGDYDMHEEPDEGDFFERTREELLMDEENPEGYLGAVDEEGKKQLLPALKEQWRYYERNVTLEQRPKEHQFKVGDLVTLSPAWKDPYLGNYSASKLPGVPDLPCEYEFNDAHNGPLFPDDVGVVIADDSSQKPYLVKALGCKTYKAGYPYEWTDEWYYIPEALVAHTPQAPLNLPSTATVRVPEHFANVKLALLNMTEGQSLEVDTGDYRFEETIEVGDHPAGFHSGHRKAAMRTLNVKAKAAGARSWGRFIFGRWATGVHTGMTYMLTTFNSYRGVVEAHGGPWTFEHCDLRCAGGIALGTYSEANVTCVKCSLGGFAWPIGPNSASDGVYTRDQSQCLLSECTIDKTGRVGGIGAYVRDKAGLYLMGCRLVHNDHAVGYDGPCTLMVYNCSLRHNRNEAFFGGMLSLYSTLHLRKSIVDGPAWFRGRVPGFMGLSGEYPADNIIEPLPEHRLAPVPGTNLTLPCQDERMLRHLEFIPMGFDGEHYSGGS